VTFKVSLDQERTERMSLESQLREKCREVLDLQAKYDSRNAEFSSRSVA
jgi:hypothetical protein